MRNSLAKNTKHLFWSWQEPAHLWRHQFSFWLQLQSHIATFIVVCDSYITLLSELLCHLQDYFTNWTFFFASMLFSSIYLLTEKLAFFKGRKFSKVKCNFRSLWFFQVGLAESRHCDWADFSKTCINASDTIVFTILAWMNVTNFKQS